MANIAGALPTPLFKPRFSVIALSFVVSASVSDSGPGPYKKAAATYRIYGGGIGDPVAPTVKDKKIAISMEGLASKELFDAIGPGEHDACTEGSGTRVRFLDEGNVTCSRSKEGEYECSFGFDLRDGKNIGGSVC